MHEIFLTASINDDEFTKTLQTLQGYCGMQPVTLLRRRLFWEGPKIRNPKGFDRKFLQAVPPVKREPWGVLSDQISRQSYVITLLYDVTRDQFGKKKDEEGKVEDGPDLDLDKMPGNLRWNDLPEPGDKRSANARQIVNIDNELNLCSILTSQSHRFTSEHIQDTRRFIYNNVIFELSRNLLLPPREDETLPSVRKKLPPFESLESFDGEGKWILTVSVWVVDGQERAQIQKGTEELMVVKEELEGVFDLKTYDRHVFDTRVKF